MFKAIRERFDETGYPKNLTIMHSAGNGNGKGTGVNLFGAEGLIKRLIAAFAGNNPDISNLITDNKCQYYCLPQGVVVQLLP